MFRVSRGMLQTLKECGNTIVGIATYQRYGEEPIKNAFKEAGLDVKIDIIDHGATFDYSTGMRYTVVITNESYHAR